MRVRPSSLAVASTIAQGFPRAFKGLGRLNLVLGFHHTWFLLFPVGTWAIDINTDPKCSRTVDPDIALISSLGLDDTMAWVAAQVTQVSVALAEACPLDFNKASGCSADPRLPCSLWWQHRLHTASQTLAVVGLCTQTWFRIPRLDITMAPGGSTGHSAAAWSLDTGRPCSLVRGCTLS